MYTACALSPTAVASSLSSPFQALVSMKPIPSRVHSRPNLTCRASSRKFRPASSLRAELIPDNVAPQPQNHDPIAKPDSEPPLSRRFAPGGALSDEKSKGVGEIILTDKFDRGPLCKTIVPSVKLSKNSRLVTLAVKGRRVV